MAIMVAGQQMPLDIGKRPHPLDGSFQCLIARLVGVVNVAGDDDYRRCMLPSEIADARDDIDAFALEDGHGVFVHHAEDLADLPIGSVDELHCFLATTASPANCKGISPRISQVSRLRV